MCTLVFLGYTPIHIPGGPYVDALISHNNNNPLSFLRRVQLLADFLNGVISFTNKLLPLSFPPSHHYPIVSTFYKNRGIHTYYYYHWCCCYLSPRSGLIHCNIDHFICTVVYLVLLLVFVTKGASCLGSLLSPLLPPSFWSPFILFLPPCPMLISPFLLSLYTWIAWVLCTCCCIFILPPFSFHSLAW